MKQYKKRSAINGKMEKTCCKCKTLLDISNFGKLKSSPDGLRYDCKNCRKDYRKQNRDKINKKLKKYYQDNKEKLLKQNKEYRINNIEQINKQRKEYRNRPEIKDHIKQKNKDYLPIKKEKIKEKRKTDKNFQLSEILRSKIHKFLNNKPTSYKNIIGCNLDFLKKWLEFRFDDKMTWDNLGKYWQIDHIIPISLFNFNDEKNKNICFHWTNLQPLLTYQNKNKSNKIYLHYYFNNIVNINRFHKKYNNFLGYQAIRESVLWLKKNYFKYGENPTDKDVNTSEIGNQQPSS